MFDLALYEKRVAELVASGHSEREARDMATFEQDGGDAKPVEAFDKERYEKTIAELMALGHDEREARDIARYGQTGGDLKILPAPAEPDAE